jgi:hypothetical protein
VSDNPFEVLKLDPSASEEHIVRRAAQLRQVSADEQALTAVRQAVQVLTGRAEDRQLHALLTPPTPAHDWPRLDRLAAAFRRPPARLAEPTAPAAVDLEEVAPLLRSLLREAISGTPPTLEPPIPRETDEEILRQTVEVLWQLLPFELPA